MEKLPQECRDHIASFLGKEALNNLVLVSKDYLGYFTASNWKRVWLKGHPKHSFIRQATILPQWEVRKKRKILKKTLRNQKDPVTGFSKPLFDEHGPLIIDAISKMTCLQRLALILIVLNDEQQGNFCTMLAKTPKWDTLKSLTICAPEGIVRAALGQCKAEVLEEVNIHAWIDTPGYAALVAMYSAPGLQYPLKKLGILYHPELSTSPAHMDIWVRMEAVITAIKDFPHLTSLSVYQEDRRECQLLAQDWDYFSATWNKLCEALADTTIQEFLFSIDIRNILPEFVQESLGLPTSEDDKWDDFNHMWLPVHQNAPHYDDFYHNLAHYAFLASPCLRRLTIVNDDEERHGGGPLFWEMKYWTVDLLYFI
ncbi:hypothetical protein FHETE_4292 [Fusarium heterosporum]|uniref:F-box domain-containing protein n=1 Tax=Fusarium heterosporum TaxID=42747 RepID=A0A8H5TH48_FUSHE|nr:hypothetical protein FHETE_4292 [Fusarium heterosporum]